ncbi:hypothetical protein HQ393_17420 (plasmid) [Chitinibacter bivalviorum]|uniref:Outer membrane beta-barrel protein n=1 Tax=Chitinibacter bivalviorum TaxID=2739434 RepID=A0A7H9BPV2_9NEIS|nr:hypothetical protein [Chitinibacter bivalviorum]QLG90091.1 hypothetical protein HQ393_17420 [Chitinibacter bivalviorum]
MLKASLSINQLWLFTAMVTSFCFAAYDADDTLKLNAAIDYRYDDNVFLLPNSSSNSITREYGQRGDSSIVASVGGRIDVPLSRQVLYVAANAARQQYLKFDELNYTSWNGQLGWKWQVGSQFSGDLNARASYSMNSFEDVRNGIIDMINDNSASWNGNWLFSSNWALLANIGYDEQTHSDLKYQDARVVNYGLGVRFNTDKGSVISLIHQWQDYSYLRNLFLPADKRGYHEQNTRLSLLWPVTANLNLTANAGLSSWKSKADTASTESKPQGDIGFNWQITDKTKVSAGVGQNFEQFNDGAGRNLERTAYFSSGWAMTEKLSWLFNFNYRQQERESTLGINGRKQNYNTTRLSAAYRPIRSVYLSILISNI